MSRDLPGILSISSFVVSVISRTSASREVSPSRSAMGQSKRLQLRPSSLLDRSTTEIKLLLLLLLVVRCDRNCSDSPAEPPSPAELIMILAAVKPNYSRRPTGASTVGLRVCCAVHVYGELINRSTSFICTKI